MKRKLLFTVTAIILAFLLNSCTSSKTLPVVSDNEVVQSGAILAESKDMGDDYIDSFLFFGESTTYHMKNRGVLSGGKDTKQILANRSGTAILDSSTYNMTVISPITGKEVLLKDAVAAVRPKYMLLTFGLNGAVGNIKKGEEYFRSCYIKLIDTIKSASPDTRIILGSCFPVASNMNMSSYTVTVKELNSYIEITNQWTLDLADDEGLRYLNVNEVLIDSNGYLKFEYQVGDGHHLTRDAYLKILEYIRTHGYK